MDKFKDYVKKNLPSISICIELGILVTALVISIKNSISDLIRVPVKNLNKLQKRRQKTAVKIQKIQARAALAQAKADARAQKTGDSI